MRIPSPEKLVYWNSYTCSVGENGERENDETARDSNGDDIFMRLTGNSDSETMKIEERLRCRAREG